MRELPSKLLIGTFILALGLIVPLSVPSEEKSQAAAAEGEALFKKHCNMCHFPDKADKKLGPGMKGILKNKELPQSHKPATEANVREQIEKGSKAMPAFGKKLSSAEIDSLMEYLKTL